METMASHPLSNPKAIAERGEEIYRNNYKELYEREQPGKFVAIDITTERDYLADTPEAALEAARAASPTGLFHLIQVGFSGAFRVSYADHATLDWLFR
jgi:hypothetical protein